MSPVSYLVVVAALVAAAQGLAVKEVRVGHESAFATAPLGLNQRREKITELIVGGSDASLGEFPHQVSMQVVLPFLWWDADPQHLCGGTLIGEEWVLTAAHCVYGVPASTKRVEAVLGITSLSRASRTAGSQRIVVSNMLVHANYDPKSNSGVGPYDIALLKLSKKASLSDTVKLAQLPAAGALSTGTATLSGWGSTSEDGNNPVYPDKLQKANFPLVDFQTCYNYISKVSPNEPNPLADTNVCVGPLDKTGLSSCSGDSGGPLIQVDANQATVIGVVSWGLANCGSIPFPSVFTRTSAYIDWIAAVQSRY